MNHVAVAPQDLPPGLASAQPGAGGGRALAALIPVAFASGVAGLGYELVWTRMLAHALGTEMMAVLGVVAGFFGGLGLGAFALDGWIRRSRAPARAYAVLETVIGLWGLASIWLLPWAGRLLPPLLGAQPAPALQWLASFLLPMIVLAPATVAMGGTLAALERMLSAAAGRDRLAALTYGANTAGAVAGTLLSVTALLPTLGMSGTLAVLAALNAACAVAAMALLRRSGSSGAPQHLRPRAGRLRLGGVLFATGLLGICFEMLVVRVAAQVMEDTIYTFAALLAAYLLGTALGGLVWQRLGRVVRGATPGWLIAGTALTCLGGVAMLPLIVRLSGSSVSAGLSGELTMAALMFLVPSFAMGALFSHLAECVRDGRGSLGWAVGINSVGAGLAPLAVSLGLIPAFGVWPSLLLVSLAYLLLLPARVLALAWGLAPLALAAGLWWRPAPDLLHVPQGGHLLAVREGAMATASAVDDASGARYLEVNGHFRMGGTNSVRSDYRQAMLPLLQHPAPRRALFLGVGTGATLVGGGLLPGVSARGVELLPEVAGLLGWFIDPDRPSPAVTIADARRFVAADDGQYDAIIADLFHPALDGSGSLYTVEQFQAVRRRLAPGGLFCQWLPLFQLDAPSLRAIIRSFLAVYPDGSAWLAHFSVRTPMLALVGTRDGTRIDPQALQARLAEPKTAAVAAQYGFRTPLDVLGQFVGGPRALAAFAGDGPLNTDDFPFVALDALRNVRALHAPPYALLLKVLNEIQVDPADLLGTSDASGLSARLGAYARARHSFIVSGVTMPAELRGGALMRAAMPGLLTALRISPDFDAAYEPLLSMAQVLLQSDRAAGIKLLRDIAAAAPARPEPRAALQQLDPP